ncbi:arsenate reductase family protein [Maritimibacter fusiformis]|uniref:Arsenate reductase n=1 Tax=Maritimibacter fusiformis TaxID=2603819 RepID=A0A5D0RNB5_9RHOB|nr:ArsC/Spx/MgsR family protein [Maritimibacter fusiformis]TYB82446.1 arsenate reductase [Maritimibacter fusiformis]
MKVYGIKSCDTVRRALRELTAAGHAPELVDVRETPLQAADLARFAETFGEALVNRRSTTWRGLDEAARAGDPAALIAAHPTLMKRPVIEADGSITLGWDKETRAKWLGNPA